MVQTNGEKYAKKSTVLEKKIAFKKQETDLLKDANFNEGDHLDRMLRDAKQNNKDRVYYLEKLNNDIVKIEKQSEKELDAVDYSNKTGLRLTQICKDATTLKKQSNIEQKAKFEAELHQLNMEQDDAERQNKKAEKNLARIKDEIDKLIGGSKSG